MNRGLSPVFYFKYNELNNFHGLKICYLIVQQSKITEFGYCTELLHLFILNHLLEGKK